MAHWPLPARRAEFREIAVSIENYNYIFSDFDSRPYSERELSEDFCKEMQRRYTEDERGRFSVNLLLPAYARNLREEGVIKKRLRGHFEYMAKHEARLIREIVKQGYIYIIVGAIVLLANVFALFTLQESSIFYQILSVVLVPAGWYGMFTGMAKVIDEPAAAKGRKEFNEHFARANFVFCPSENKK